MKLSARGHHSMEAILDLAIHYGEGPIPIRDIAMRGRISEPYLGQLFVPLRIAGLVRSVRGAGGGFVLARDPAEIRLSEIVEATEGSTSLTECVDAPCTCWKGQPCAIRDVWMEIRCATHNMLNSLTLRELVRRWREG